MKNTDQLAHQLVYIYIYIMFILVKHYVFLSHEKLKCKIALQKKSIYIYICK